MRSCDLFGDLGEGRIGRSAILEPILGDGHSMGATVPLADKAGTGFQSEIWRRPNSPCCPQGLGQCLQLAQCRLAESAVIHFLAPVGDTEDQEILTELGWLALIKTSPFATQIVQALACLNDLRWLRGRRRRMDGSPSHGHAARRLGFVALDLGLSGVLGLSGLFGAIRYTRS